MPTGQTDGRTPDRYITLSAGRGQRNNGYAAAAAASDIVDDDERGPPFNSSQKMTL